MTIQFSTNIVKWVLNLIEEELSNSSYGLVTIDQWWCSDYLLR